jgi:hypothetical protein
MMDDVAHYQEVVRKSLLPDDAELQIQPILQLGGNRGIAPAGPLQRQLSQLIEGSRRICYARRNCPAADRDGVAAAFGDLFCRPQRLGTIGKVTGQFGPRSEPRLLRPYLGGGKRRECGVERNGPEQAMAAPVLGVRGHHSIGCHDR